MNKLSVYTPRGRHAQPINWVNPLLGAARLVLAGITVGVVLAYLTPAKILPDSPGAPRSIIARLHPVVLTRPTRSHAIGRTTTHSSAPRAPKDSPSPSSVRATPAASIYTARGAVYLIHRYFPRRAWAVAAHIVACESTFHYWAHNLNRNGTIDRGLFQLNSGGTEQELLRATGQSPTDLDLAYNPVWNVRAASVLYRRDGWSRWTCDPAKSNLT